jgi:O-antigen/teichoic acid export membrane protein
VWTAKVVLAAGIVVAGILLAKPLHVLLMKQGPDANMPAAVLMLSFAGAATVVLSGFPQACFQARQRFVLYASLDLVTSVCRLVLVAALALTGRLTTTLALGAYVAAPAVTLVAGFALLPRNILSFRAGNAGVWRELRRFTQWVLLACCCTSLAQRLDVFLIAAYKQPVEAVADYGAAVQLMLIADLAVMSLFSVLLPKAGALTSRRERAAFLASFLYPTALAALALLPVIALAGPIAHLTFGAAYVNTGALLAVLLTGALFTLGSAPAGAVLYGQGHSRAIAALEAVKLLGILVLGLIAVPTYGVFGMAWSLAIVKAGIGVATYALAAANSRCAA